MPLLGPSIVSGVACASQTLHCDLQRPDDGKGAGGVPKRRGYGPVAEAPHPRRQCTMGADCEGLCRVIVLVPQITMAYWSEFHRLE